MTSTTRRKGKYHYCDKVHYDSGRGERPLCGAFSSAGWYVYGNPEAYAVTCKSCLRIDASGAKK